MPWPMLASLTKVMVKTSPTLPCRVGPGAVPLKVHRVWRTPGAISTTVSRTVMVSRCSLAPGVGCRAGSYGFQPGPGEARKSMTGATSPAGAAFAMAPISGPDPGAFAAELAALPVPVTTILRVIPATLCPGPLPQPAISALTTPTVRVAFSPPASSGVRCPVARTRSWRMASAFVTFRTSRVPFVTSITAGVFRSEGRILSTGKQRSALPGGQDQVVAHGVGVRDLQDEPGSLRHVDHRGRDPHPGEADRDGLGPAGRDDDARVEARTSTTTGQRDHEGDDEHDGTQSQTPQQAGSVLPRTRFCERADPLVGGGHADRPFLRACRTAITEAARKPSTASSVPTPPTRQQSADPSPSPSITRARRDA